MAQRKTEFVQGNFYHLYNRGNSRQQIFLDDQDRDRFVKLLYLSNSHKSINFRDDIVHANIEALDFDRGTPLVAIGVWVLMSNHFHLLVSIPESPKTGVGESKENEVVMFMRKLSTSYAKYFNKKYSRTGALFESRFKSSVADTDEYLKYLFSYIHLNPIKIIDPMWREKGVSNLNDANDFLDTYRWSSFTEYKGLHKRPFEKIIQKEVFPDYFYTDTSLFENEIFEWLSFEPLPKTGVGERES